MTTITPNISYDHKYFKSRKKKKRIVIVNKARFILATVITLILLSIIIGYVTGTMTSEATTQMKSVEYEVSFGDTLWSIASEHNYYEQDVREVIHDIKAYNHLSNASIHPGDVIYIPLSR